jgi:hypothetical protein
MKIVAGGSRGWRDPVAIREKLLEHWDPYYTEVIVGDANGADELIELVGHALNYDVFVFRAKWRPGGPGTKVDRRAGHIRNARMLDENPDLVLAFWDGYSPGTAGLIREARRRGIPVEIVRG